jgi:hypothetical protein
MHEPSSRPFARRERINAVNRKGVSVEGHWDFEQLHVSKFSSFKSSFPASRLQRRIQIAPTGGEMKNLGSETRAPRHGSLDAPGFPLCSSMRRRVVDDVQGSCYYQTVPRVKSGLPVYGRSVWMRNLRGRQTPGKFWLSFEEIRTRLEWRPGTPSLKHPAKTFAAREAMPGEADETERLRTGVKARRGVTVVGDLV